MGKPITITENELASMEAALQTGLRICYRLKPGLAASTPGSRKGLNVKDKARMLIKRRRSVNRSAS